jgi:zinc transport system ATP-binding protein
MENEPVIEIKGLWAGYEGHTILEDVNLTVRQSDFIGLIGPNGGGKTTLLKTLIGLIQPERGEIRVMGKSVAEGRCHIGYVPQFVDFDRQFPIRVWEVVQMGLLGCRKPLQRITGADRETIRYALEQVEMADLQQRAIGDLSVGQRQRVYIARALASNPQILLLDEPTASIDPQVAGTIYELLRRLNQTVTILMISHDMNAVSSHVKSIGCLNRRLHYHGDKEVTQDMLEAIYECPVDLIAHGLPHRVLSEHAHAAGEAHTHTPRVL